MLAQKLGVTPEYLETGSELDASELRELRLAEQELRLRLEGESDVASVRGVLADADEHADVAAATRARIVLGLEAASRGDHLATVAHLSQVVGSELVTPADGPMSTRRSGARTRPPARRARRSRCSSARSPSSQSVEPENLPARVRYSTYLSYALTDLGELQRAKAVVAEVFASAGDVADRYTRVRLYWSLGRLSLEQAQTARGARQLPPRGRAPRGDRGHRPSRARPHRLRRRDDHRGRRPRRSPPPPRGGGAAARRASGQRRPRRRPPHAVHVCDRRRGHQRSRASRRSRLSLSPPTSPTSRVTPGGRSPRRGLRARTSPPTRPTGRRSHCSRRTARCAITRGCCAHTGAISARHGAGARGARRLRARRRCRVQPAERARRSER